MQVDLSFVPACVLVPRTAFAAFCASEFEGAHEREFVQFLSVIMEKPPESLLKTMILLSSMTLYAIGADLVKNRKNCL
jgi:hypothetical protein